MLAANLKAVLDRTPGERIVIIAQWPDGTRAGSQVFDLHSCETVHATNHRGETMPMLALVVGAQVDSCNGRQYGDMVCFCGHIRRDHGPSSELGAEFYRADACLKCGAKVCDEFQWDRGLSQIRRPN